jgi:uncharacterized membrane protein YhhN
LILVGSQPSGWGIRSPFHKVSPVGGIGRSLDRVWREWILNVNQVTAFDKAGLPFQKRARLVIALTALAAISAAIEIGAQYLGPRTIVYIFKPLTMVFIIAIALIRVCEFRGYRNLIVAALCCSLAGDVFLMLPADRFVSGLLTFLIAHLFYIAAFRTRPSGSSSAWCGLACVAYGSLMLRFLFPYLGDMKLPVSIYLVVILLMAWQALNGWVTNRRAGAGLAALGAVLFVASDSMIAINRFTGGFRLAELLILATYFTAQCLIALSIRSGGTKSIAVTGA